MRAVLRYLVLFGGIVLMINGCNGLVSGGFGTHKLRSISLNQIETEGLRDADYISIPGGVIGPAEQETMPGMFAAPGSLQRPILSPAQLAAYQAGDTVTAYIIAWAKFNLEPASAQNAKLFLDTVTNLTGLVSIPPATVKANYWAVQKIDLADDPKYIQIGEKPMDWYWNLALFLGGLLLAAVPEAMTFKTRGAKAGPT